MSIVARSERPLTRRICFPRNMTRADTMCEAPSGWNTWMVKCRRLTQRVELLADSIETVPAGISVVLPCGRANAFTLIDLFDARSRWPSLLRVTLMVADCPGAMSYGARPISTTRAMCARARTERVPSSARRISVPTQWLVAVDGHEYVMSTVLPSPPAMTVGGWPLLDGGGVGAGVLVVGWVVVVSGVVVQ